jgi:hypothetical protein
MNSQNVNVPCIHRMSDVEWKPQHPQRVLAELPIPPPSPQRRHLSVNASDSCLGRIHSSSFLKPFVHCHLPDGSVEEKRQIAQPRRVTFCSLIRVKEVRHRNETPAYILEATWLTPEEYATIRDVLRHTVRLMMSGQLVDQDPHSEGYSSRGLETRTKEGHMQRNQRRSSCRQAVFNEQAHQRRIRSFSPEKISAMSIMQSAQCAMDAQNKAIKDAHEAREYLSHYHMDCTSV